MASATVGTLRALLTADTTAFDAAMAGASKKTQAWSQDFTKLGLSAQQVGSVIVNSMDRSLASVDRLAKAFSGAGVAKAADEMAAAINRLPNGVLSLTASQQASVNAQVTEAIAKYRALGQEAPTHLLKIQQATQKAADGTKSFGESLTANFSKLGPSIASTAAGMVTGLLTVDALKAGFHELTAFVGDCIEAFEKQELASKHVEAALRSNGTFTPALAHQYNELASAFEKTTVNADELNSEAIAMFTSLGEVGPAQMRQAMQGAADLSAAMGIDLMSAVEMISKGLTGSSERLKKLTGDFEDSADKGQKLENMLGAINARFGGRAAADIQTYSGQMKQMANQWDNFKENIGQVIIQNPDIQNALRTVNALLTEQATDARKAADEWEAYLLRRMNAGQGLPKSSTSAGKDISVPVSVPAVDATTKLSLALQKLVRDIAAVPPATKAAIVEGDRLGVSTKDLSEKLKINEDIVKGVVDAHKKLADAAKAAGKDAAAYAKEIKGLSDDLTGAKLDAEIQKLTDVVIAAGGAENIMVLKGEALVKQLKDMEAQGRRLTPVLQTVVDRFQNWNTAGIKIQSGLGSIVKWMPDVTKAIQDDQKAVDKQQEAWDKMLRTVPGLPPAFMKITAVGIKKWGKEGADSSDALTKSLGELATAFSQMAQIGGSGFGQVARAMGTTVIAIQGLVKSADLLTDGTAFDAKKLASLAASWVGVAVAVYQVASAIAASIQQSHQQQNAIKDIRREMLGIADEMIDASMSVGAFFSPEMYVNGQKVRNITAALATDIANLSTQIQKMDFSISAATARHYAELLMLDKIIDNLGGLTSDNLVRWETQAERLFEVVARGGELGARASEELVTLMDKFAKQAESTGGLWSDAFKRLIDRSREAGIGIEKITELVKGQQDKLAGGANGVTAAIGKQAATYKELAKAVEDAIQAGDPDKVTAAQAKLAKAVVTTQGEFDRLSRIELAAFNTLVASGIESVTAMGQVGAGIDALIANADAFGLAGNAAFDELKRWRELTTDNAALLSQIGSLNDLLTASANLGSLTADGFSDLEAQGVSAFQQLTAAGLSQQEAEMAMKPLLETIIKLHEERGLAIDEETQKLIDQARADGVLKAASIDSARVQLDLLAALVTAVGGTLPDSYRKMAEAAKQAAHDTQVAWDSVDIQPIPVEFQYHTTGDRPDFSVPDQPDSQLPQFSRGTLGKWIDFGAGTPVVLHDWERVMTKAEAVMPQFGGSYLPQGAGMNATTLDAGAATPPIVVKTYLNGRQVARALVPEIPGVVKTYQLGRR